MLQDDIELGLRNLLILRQQMSDRRKLLDGSNFTTKWAYKAIMQQIANPKLEAI